MTVAALNTVVVDTNVAVTANGKQLPTGVSRQCVAVCARRLQAVQTAGIVAIDNQWRILREYRANLREAGQPGVGDAWLKWLLTNLANPTRCHQVPITPRGGGNDFAEFPSDPDLQTFDQSDRKFVAVSLAHPANPPVLNATDSDWRNHHTALERHGVIVEYLCPEYLSPMET
jgi:hypothetical protein